MDGRKCCTTGGGHRIIGAPNEPTCDGCRKGMLLHPIFAQSACSSYILQARREKEAEAHRLFLLQQAKEEEELETQIRAEKFKQKQQFQQAQTQPQTMMLRRAISSGGTSNFSDSFAPGGIPTMGDTPVEKFGEEICIDGVRFTSVKLFHPRHGAFLPIRNSYGSRRLVWR